MTHYLSRDLCTPHDLQRFRLNGDEYILRGKLGDGAAGLVRRAERLKDQARFAVKFLAPDPKYISEERFDDASARFKREGERGSQLDHYALLKIYTYASNHNGMEFEGGQPRNPFLLMELSTGGTLEDYIRRLHPSLRGVVVVDETRLSIALQIANAIDYLHRRKIVHRDIKPGNIFLSSRQVENPEMIAKLGDFGIVKWGDFHASLTTGVLTATMQRELGTMKYMSPEHALRPKDVAISSDIFSFGVTLFELFTGKILPSFHHVFEIMIARDTRGTTISRWLQLGMQVNGADEGLCEIMLEMLRKGSTGRPGIQKVRGHLAWEFERRFDRPWVAPTSPR